MSDIEVVIKIPEEVKNRLCFGVTYSKDIQVVCEALNDGTPLTPDILADLLMEERIRGGLKQDISYSKDIIDDVKCKLTVDIIDHRPCYCGAGLREVWRESEEA